MPFSHVHCSALLGLHSFTECDSKSAIKGNGKLRPLGIHQKSPKYEEVNSKFGDTRPVSEDIMTKLEAFVHAVYGKLRIQDVNIVQFMKIDKSLESRNTEFLEI